MIDRESYMKLNVPWLLEMIQHDFSADSPHYPGWKVAADRLTKGEYFEAESSCIELLASGGKSASVYCTLFLIYVLSDREDDAKIALMEAHDLDPLGLVITVLWADFMSMGPAAPLACTVYEKAIAMYPDDPYAYRMLGILDMNLHEYAGACESLRHLVQLTPDDDDAWLFLGMSLVNSGQARAASGEFAEYVRARSNNFGLWYAFGNILAVTKDWVGAERAFRRAIELQPDDPDARAYLAAAFKATGRNSAAIKGFRRVVRDHPDHFNSWMNLGILLMEEMRDDEAREAFGRAYDISPSEFDLAYRGIRCTLEDAKEERMRRARARESMH